MKVSLVIPTLNEEKAIGKVLSRIPNNIVDEMIVVDSSSDATAKIAASFGAKVVFEHGKGYGRALQSGIEKSEGEIVVYMDGDYTYDPKDILKIVGPILSGKCDVVVGNRLNRMMYPDAMNLLNRFGNFVISLVFSIAFLKRVIDTQCGLRAIRKKFLNELSYRDYGMPYVTEQLIKLVKKGARIGNVAVTYRPRIGKTKLCAWTDGFKILKVILRGRFEKSC
jgi:glycosyltransferase involved in cell wall biosynthesis